MMTNPGGKVVANLREKFMFREAIRWFPGHMTKGLKQMQSRLKRVDCIIEVHDARIPISGRYADFSKTLTGLKPHILVLSKIDLADAKYKRNIVSTLNREGLSNVIFTNLKDEKCKGMRKILPLAKKLMFESQRYNRISEESYAMMVIGVPNVGKSSLINRLRSNHLNMSKATHVGAQAGITRSVLTHIKISEDPRIYLFDTPGILVPTIKDIHAGFKLSVTGCLQDHVVGFNALADYLLFWLNKHGRFEYVEYLGLPEPNDSVMYVLIFIAAKFKRTVKVKVFDGIKTVPHIQFAAEYFISSFRAGKFGTYCLDVDLLETSQDSDIKLA